MINFVKTKSSIECQNKLYDTLINNIKSNKKILLIVAGGSNVPIIKAVFDKLPDDLTSNIDLILSDERYGSSDFKDSNFVKLQKAGFNIKKAHFENILTNQSIDESTRILENQFARGDKKAEVIIALLGIGQDGHIAGILPNSKALNSESYATSYRALDFDRITLSFKALKKINIAIIGAYGIKKRMALINLKKLELPIEEMPSKILQEIKSNYIYNDQIG